MHVFYFFDIFHCVCQTKYKYYVITFRIRIVVRVQDESGSSSFVLFERHVKDLIHRGNQWLMDKIAKVSKNISVI